MPTAAEKWPHLYKSRRWQKLRRVFLSLNPYCVFCKDEDRITPAVELDHIEKHNGDATLFFDEKNLQGLCRYHHRVVKAAMERGEPRRGCDVNGVPFHRRQT